MKTLTFEERENRKLFEEVMREELSKRDTTEQKKFLIIKLSSFRKDNPERFPSFYENWIETELNKINELEKIENPENKTINDKWNNLYVDLINHGFIQCDQEIFNNVMEYKRLPGGKNKILWLGRMNEAGYFRMKFNFYIAEFNNCFINTKGRLFHTHDGTPGGTRSTPLIVQICEDFDNIKNF